MQGKIHSVFSGGTVDGPGIRFVVFTQGCPLRCKYCHNPDSWLMSDGEYRTVQDLTSEIIKYRNYFGDKGGLTISGGEPLMQIDFCIELCKSVKKYRINTAIDTSGFTFNIDDESCVQKFTELIKYVDLFLLDIKHIRDDEHIKLTGVTNKNTLNFAKWLSDNGKKMWIRHVLLDGYTDIDEHLIELSNFISTLKTVEKVEVLPYHTLGEVKYEKLGYNYSLKGVNPPSKERINNAKEILKLKNVK